MPRSLIILLASVVLLSPADAAPLPAFPGAAGFHTELCTHGRGGRVLRVTSLEDHKQGPPREGTFRWACESFDEPRVIVFAVGGVIRLEKAVRVKPHVYIAGQTAPGDGVCLCQGGLELGSNTLIRHLRIRPGDRSPPGTALTKRDGFQSHGDNIILDHCSISWTTDECFRTNGGENILLSYCFFGEGLHIARREEFHNYGPALEPNAATGGMTKNIAIHHCLFNGFAARSPLIGNGDREVHLVFANNVLYNYGGLKYPPVHTYQPKRGVAPQLGNMDIVGNYFKAGPVTPENCPTVQVHGAFPSGALYVSGNLAPTHSADGPGEWEALLADGADPAVAARRSLTPLNDVAVVHVTDARTALDAVLAEVGATAPRRDAVDARFVSDVRSGSAFVGVDGPRPKPNRPGYTAYYDYILEDPARIVERHAGKGEAQRVTLDDLDAVPGAREFYETFRGSPPPPDTDLDGLPDDWERTQGLDPADPADNVRPLPSGYTAIEQYVNELPTASATTGT